jgi:hypothetical protein
VFEIPVHPGVAPVHPPNPTGQQITETNRQSQPDIDDHQLFLTVREALKQQILLAVEYRYLQVLEDADMGFADITPSTILAHLKATYGAINQEDIEINRALLGSDFNPDDPIEDTFGFASRNASATPPTNQSLTLPPSALSSLLSKNLESSAPPSKNGETRHLPTRISSISRRYLSSKTRNAFAR